MRTSRGGVGPFQERPFYSLNEIERICVEALRGVDLLPSSPEQIRIDRFIEKRFSVTPSYEDLGEGILGLTRFGRNGVQEVIVSQRLDDEGSVVANRRIRSTLAHEAGHGLLHEYLFLLEQETPLFGEKTPEGPKVLCRDGPAANKDAYKGKWWEYQANRAIGSLLLPRTLVHMAVEPYTLPAGGLGLRSVDRGRRPEVIQQLVQIFDVNPIVAAIRFDDLFPAEKTSQIAL